MIGSELYRLGAYPGRLIVTEGWDDGLEVTARMADFGEIVVKLDQYEARDLALALSLWRSERRPPVGPPER